MASSEDADRLAAILAESGFKDAFYVKLFGVNQSTVARLRQGKIAKVQRYISLIEANSALATTPDRELASMVGQLVELSAERPALRSFLANVHRFVHEAMHGPQQNGR